MVRPQAPKAREQRGPGARGGVSAARLDLRGNVCYVLPMVGRRQTGLPALRRAGAGAGLFGWAAKPNPLL